MSVIVKDNTDKFRKWNDGAVDLVLNSMAIDIERLAKMVVPVGKESEKKGNEAGWSAEGFYHAFPSWREKYVVIANKEYAAYQEFGGDGTRVVRNYSKPGTGKEYLRASGKKIGEDFPRRYTSAVIRLTETSFGGTIAGDTLGTGSGGDVI